MLIQRRAFLTGLGSLLAAPAVVHAGNLMPVRSIERLLLPDYGFDSFHSFNMDVAYQWVATYDDPFQLSQMIENGWRPVPASRHNKQFQIKGDTIEFAGNTLMQRTRLAVEEARGKEIQKARALVDNWCGDVRVTSDTDIFITPRRLWSKQ